jgi:hypothetical protein
MRPFERISPADVVALLSIDLTTSQREPVKPVRNIRPVTGRNQRCPCGSGKKYKHCHRGQELPKAA